MVDRTISVSRGTSTPTNLLRLVRSPAAWGFFEKPTSSAIRLIFSVVLFDAARTPAGRPGVSTRETVDTCTPASAATVRSVGRPESSKYGRSPVALMSCNPFPHRHTTRRPREQYNPNDCANRGYALQSNPIDWRKRLGTDANSSCGGSRRHDRQHCGRAGSQDRDGDGYSTGEYRSTTARCAPARRGCP